MNVQDFLDKWKKFAASLNDKGVPLPMIRDPKTALGSVSLTLVFISFNIVLLGLIGKAAGALGGVDLTQALNLFYACGALYWGRKFQGSSTISSDSPDSQATQSAQTPPSKTPPKVDNPD